MNAIARLKSTIKASPLAVPYILAKSAFGAKRASQSDESRILADLAGLVAAPKCFIEFGFSGWEFNCIGLAQDPSWTGLLVDGQRYSVTVARTIYHRGVEARQLWISLDTIDTISAWADGKDLGVLSVDVDGNDYWFLQRLIVLRPAIIVAEVNVSLGLRPITVPYEADFDRTKKHETWEYYGASLAAVHHLCTNHGYTLVAVSSNGVNAFFVRDDRMVPSLRALLPQEARRPKMYPDGSIAPSERHWERIRAMPFVDVTTGRPFTSS